MWYSGDACHKAAGYNPVRPESCEVLRPHATWSFRSRPIWYPPNGVVSRCLLCMATQSLHLHGWQRLCRSQSTRWDSD